MTFLPLVRIEVFEQLTDWAWPHAVPSAHVLPWARPVGLDGSRCNRDPGPGRRHHGTVIVAVQIARTDRKADDLKREQDRQWDSDRRKEDRGRDDQLRREDRERDDRLRREAAEDWERRTRAERLDREDYEARQVTQPFSSWL